MFACRIGPLYGPQPAVLNHVRRRSDPTREFGGYIENIVGSHGLFSHYTEVDASSGAWEYRADFNYRRAALRPACRCGLGAGYTLQTQPKCHLGRLAILAEPTIPARPPCSAGRAICRPGFRNTPWWIFPATTTRPNACVCSPASRISATRPITRACFRMALSRHSGKRITPVFRQAFDRRTYSLTSITSAGTACCSSGTSRFLCKIHRRVALAINAPDRSGASGFH